MDIKGVAAVVTGGASGLGAATARLLAAAGAKVSIFDMNAAAGERLASEIGGHFQTVDITDDTSVENGLRQAHDRHGIARILVNCAGISPVAPIINDDGTAHSADLALRVIKVNLLGTFHVLARFAARLVVAVPLGEERGGIIYTASIAAYEGQMMQAAHAAAKGGIVALTLPAARDLARHMIRVMTIAPGMFRTAMLDVLSEQGKNQLGERVPFPNRLGHPEEFAQLVASIVSNPLLHGAVIRLDGAHRLQP